MSSKTIELFWHRVDEKLKMKDITLLQLSQLTDIAYSRFAAWRYKVRIPDPDSLIKISSALEISLDFLLKGIETSKLQQDELHEALDSDSNLRKIIKTCIKNPKLAVAINAMIQASEYDKNADDQKKQIG